MTDILADGVPCIIGQAVLEALRGAPQLAGLHVFDNPARALTLQEGAHIIVFEDGFDRPRQQPGQVAQRSYGFQIAVISRAASASRQSAHRHWRAVRLLLRQLLPALHARGVQIDGSGLQEGEIRFRLENIDTGGACVAGEFTIDYRERYP